MKTATARPTSSRSPTSTRARFTNSQTTSGSPRPSAPRKPTTDTYSLQQGQDEFFFVLPYDRMDIILCGLNGVKTAGGVAKETGLTAEQVERVFRDIRTKRSTTRPLHLGPVMVEAVPEITK